MKLLVLGLLLGMPAVLAQRVQITQVAASPELFSGSPDAVIPIRAGQARVSYRQNDLFVSFKADQPTSLYTYVLTGQMGRAVQTKDSFALFTNLPNGEYTFSVTAGPQLGTRPSRLRIIVESPIWLRWWFLPLLFGCSLLFVGSFLYLIYRYRLRQLLRMQLVRDRIARDLHDDMGSYLSSISILSAAMPIDPVRAQQNLDRIGQTARQVMDNMSDIVWSINPTQDTMQQVLDRMKQVADDLFGTTDTAIQFEIGPGVESLSLPLERRRDFFLVYKEVLTNAARYAEATSVQIHLQHINNQLHLQLLDNGVGFDPATPVTRPGGGNGLRNLAHRADSLSGTFTIKSAPGQGTQVDLRLPI